MKNIFYLLSIVLTVFASSCTEDFEDWNTDKKNPAEVSGNALFSNAEKDLADQLNTPNVNWNNWNLWAQYWTETTYTDEANFDIVNRNVPQNVYRAFYRRVLKDLDEAASLITEEEVTGTFEVDKQNRLHIIEILNVFVYSRLVDIFGMVPYTDALDIENVYPGYDAGEDIYADLFTRLNAAINGLDESGGSYGSADFYYGGDVSKWIKFGNTLKIRMAITIADYDNSTAKAAVEQAYSGAFESPDDDCLMPYATSSPNFNPIHENLVASGRDDYVAANTIVDVMNGLNDPRRAYYFEQHQGSYVGGTYGETSAFQNYSHVADPIQAPDFKGIILTYNELQFYLAEAAARGYNVGDTPENLYEDAIKTSIEWWGGTEDEVNDYLAQSEVDYAAAIAASTAAEPWREVIGTQSWIASYINGFVGWTTWRRLDYPVLNMPPTPYDDITSVPTRFTFPINEQTLNEKNYQQATSAIGGDELVTKIFWDKF
jgi:hypothetical protein